MAQSPTGIELKARVFPPYMQFLSFLYFLNPLMVVINGQPVPAKWGTQFIALSPGTNNVEIAHKLYFLIKVNAITTQVTLSEGQVQQVVYSMRWFFLLPGKVSVQPWTPAAAAA